MLISLESSMAYYRPNFSKRRSKVRTSLAITFLLLSTSAPVTQSGRPIPPGLHEAQKAEEQAQQNEVPPPTQRLAPDPAKIKRDADELALLAQSIPQDVDKAANGILPKDLNAKLKKIEKLAKQLRGQLTP
jgi:hypothetical protein